MLAFAHGSMRQFLTPRHFWGTILRTSELESLLPRAQNEKKDVESANLLTRKLHSKLVPNSVVAQLA